MNRLSNRASALVLVLGVLPAAPAAASGFLSARFGGEHGHPTTDNPTAMYYNPAGLSLGTGTRLYLDGTLALVSGAFDRDPGGVSKQIEAGSAPCPGGQCTGTPVADLDRNSGENALFNIAAAPFIGAVSDFGVPNLGVGLAFYAPFGGASVWDKVDKLESDSVYPGAYDGAQRWWSIEGTIRSLYFTGAGAYTFPSINLSVGLGVNAIKSEIHTIRARNSSNLDETVSLDSAKENATVAEGRSRVDVSSWNLGLSAGLLWKPAENVWIGASYQSQPGLGKMKLEGDLELSLAGAPPAAPQKIRLEQELPDVTRLGGRWRPTPVTEVRLFGEYARWSVFERQCILTKDAPEDACALGADGGFKGGPTGAAALEYGKYFVQNIERDWEDAFGVRAGGSYWLSPELELYVGGGFDSNAVPDETMEPAIPDFNKFTAALGARVELLDKTLALAGTYTHVFYLSREISPFAQDADGIPQSGLGFESRAPDAAGSYTRTIGVFNLNAQYSF